MNRTAMLVAVLLVAAGAAQAQTQDPDEEQEEVTEEFDESVRTERDERPATETREQGPRSEYNEPYDKQRDLNPPPIEDAYDRRADDTETNADDPYRADVREQQAPEGAGPASTATLPGKTVVTSQGEEVGTIEQVGYSRQHDERVATVNVGGFLGAGDTIIAIPVSELALGDDEDDFVTTSMDRRTLETAPRFDPSQLITAETRAPSLQN